MPKTPKGKKKRPKQKGEERKTKAKRLKFDEDAFQHQDNVDSDAVELEEKDELIEDDNGGKDLETILEEHADKNNLSAINVKSILHVSSLREMFSCKNLVIP